MTGRNFLTEDVCVTKTDEVPAGWPEDLELMDGEGEMLCLCSGDKCNGPNIGGASAVGVAVPMLCTAALLSITLLGL